ncbi:hypothetical protein RvY_13313-2 [Ramazzottius varieornatus]|uniref:Peptidase S1 domain-containing protein n=1 Tax=Ramazzottius varieornatus TaxID=947166 RepID=A0A1D1VME8_RAMVA|nr:hypothetical protein RvY_13313-2 [Ramazzottius varieornatus]
MILPTDYTGNHSSGPTTDNITSQPRISDLDVIPYFRADIFSLDSESTPASRSAKRPAESIRKYVSKKRPNTTNVKSENQEITCGQRDLTYKMVRVGRIVGGETAGFGDWPWMAMLLNYGRPRCGATLIAPQVVVTAAHCVSGNRLLTNLTVKLGMFNTNERDNVLFPPVLLRVARVIRHPDFDLTTLLNDVAIIQLSEAVKYAPNILPICVGSQEPVAGWNTTILGWGKEEESMSSQFLQMFLHLCSIWNVDK